MIWSAWGLGDPDGALRLDAGGAAVDPLGQRGEGAGQGGGVGAVGDGVRQCLAQDAAAGFGDGGGERSQEQRDQPRGDSVEADLAQGGSADPAGLDAAGDGVLVPSEGACGPGAGGGRIGDPLIQDVAQRGSVGEGSAVTGLLGDGLGEQVVLGPAEPAGQLGDRGVPGGAAGLDGATTLATWLSV